MLLRLRRTAVVLAATVALAAASVPTDVMARGGGGGFGGHMGGFGGGHLGASAAVASPVAALVVAALRSTTAFVAAALRSIRAFVVAALGEGSMAAIATGTGLATTATRTSALYVPLVSMAGDRRRVDDRDGEIVCARVRRGRAGPWRVGLV